MSFFGRLFGTEKALTAAIDGVSSGLDKLVYTDEEKADAAAADRSEARKMVVGWMQATQGQNLARRLLALSITAVWLLQYIAARLFDLAAVWAAEPIKLQASSIQMQSGADSMGGPVMLILGFYFAAPHMGDIAKAVLNRGIK